MTRRLVTTVLAAAVVALAVSSLNGRPAAEGEPLLPDLWSSAPFELQVATLDGRHVLRFTSEINNAGDGALVLRGSTRRGDFSQWISHSVSGHTVEPVDVDIAWGGDTHYHWHVADVARYWVESVEGEPLDGGFDNKVGFCFFDGVDRHSELPEAPEVPVYLPEGCGSRLNQQLSMGLSVGWGDQYRYDLRGQFIDIEDLPEGRYRLVARVDPDGRFVESDVTNNTASTEFMLLVDANGERTVLPDA